MKKKLFTRFLAPFFCLSLFLGLAACQSSGENQDPNENGQSGTSANQVVTDPSEGGKNDAQFPEMSFSHTKYDFGTIYSGQKVQHQYRFKNTGKKPLVIESAQASCGCTVPEWPEDPIAPGDSGTIFVEFDSKGKRGVQNKTVTITANTYPSKTVLDLTGEVKKGQPAEGPVDQ